MKVQKAEFPYAKPFAEALVNDPAALAGDCGFQSWVLKKTRTQFAMNSVDKAVLLHKEMLAKRTPGTPFWWRHHHNPKACNCFGCKGGKETDILAIFEAAKRRLALHVEVKYPGDELKDEQVGAYKIRAECWRIKAPNCVLEHHDATIALLFSELDRQEYGPYLDKFDTWFTFEEIEEKFPILFGEGDSYPA